MVTLSVIKADTGGYVGHCDVHPEMIAEARRRIADAVGELLIDGQVATCGDDLSLIMSHGHGVESTEVHAYAWATFVALTGIAKRLGLYGAGQDMLADAFSGNLRGMGPGYAGPRDMSTTRPSTGPGAPPTRSWTTCGSTAPSSRTDCPCRILNTPR